MQFSLLVGNILGFVAICFFGWIAVMLILVIINNWPEKKFAHVVSAEEVIQAITSPLEDKKLVKLFPHIRYQSVDEIRRVHDSIIRNRLHLFGELQAQDRNTIL